MKRIIILLIGIFLTLVMFIYLFNRVEQPRDLKVDSATALQIKAPKPKVNEWGLLPDEPRRCYLFGPFAKRELVGIFHQMKRKRLTTKVILRDRFQPEHYIVYLGPLPNKTAQRAFMKQFRQQGYPNLKYLNDGVMAPGIEIASFKMREEAYAYLETRAPKVKGLRVTNVLGEPLDDTDFCLDNLTASEEASLLSIAKRMPRKKLRACPP